jgi:hypothetical protein
VIPPQIQSSTFLHNGWTKYGANYYFYSPSRGSTTHIHIGGSAHGDSFGVTFISLKVNDSFAGKIWDKDMIYSNWGVLDGIDHTVASEFRKGLSAIGIY